MNYNVFYTYDTDIGEITVASDGEAVTSLLFGHVNIAAGQPGHDAITDLAARMLREYLARERRRFDVPLRPRGTDFQLAVWNELRKIPYGETRSYKQVAQAVGKPEACRAVGMANNKNPISILIPCHRVIGADGSLAGYGGGIHIKKKLLELENVRPMRYTVWKTTAKL